MKTLYLLLAFLLISLVSSTAYAESANSSQLLAQAQSIFLKLRAAEQQGANVTSLAEQMNQAFILIELGNTVNSTNPSVASSYYQQATQMMQSVDSSIPQAIAQGRASNQAEMIYLASYFGVLAAAGFFSYFYLPKLFWRFWLRMHGNWEVKLRQTGRRDNKGER